MTPPALPGEMWRGTLGDVRPRHVAIVHRPDGLRAVEWARHPDGGEWHRVWDEGAMSIFRAWGEQMASERDAARGVAQLAAEERDAAVTRAERAEHAVVRCHAAELLSEGQAAKILAGSASDIDRIDLRDRVLAHEEALRAEGRADAEARHAVPPLREPLSAAEVAAVVEANPYEPERAVES